MAEVSQCATAVALWPGWQGEARRCLSMDQQGRACSGARTATPSAGGEWAEVPAAGAAGPFIGDSGMGGVNWAH